MLREGFWIKNQKTKKYNIVCETWLNLVWISEAMSYNIMNPVSFLYFISQHQCKPKIVRFFFNILLPVEQVYSVFLELIYMVMYEYLYLNVQKKWKEAGSSENFDAILYLSR